MEKDHGVLSAFYSNLPGPKQTPVLECLCGWSTTGAENWEDAGSQLDIHLFDTALASMSKVVEEDLK
ncbi:MAG: hypothetical protein KGI50_06105 [Patescibacteria group bacterium]|nr:hypothetical protein [Patescibacteria group bacterium]MDE2439085.1 hypothetical protein [Patescibacteria group bacterium]